MRKTFLFFLLISFLIFIQCDIDGCQAANSEDSTKCDTCKTGYLITLAKTCIKGCATADTAAGSAKCATCTTEANISTDKLSCIANCKETGDNSGLCKTCKDGYTLSSDKTTCTKASGSDKESESGDEKGEDDNGFGLRFSLVILALVFLF